MLFRPIQFKCICMDVYVLIVLHMKSSIDYYYVRQAREIAYCIVVHKSDTSTAIGWKRQSSPVTILSYIYIYVPDMELS